MRSRSAAYASAPWRRATLAARNFATVAEDIADIKSMIATKDEARAILREELAPIHAELKAIRRELDDLQEKFENVSGFRKQIDHVLGRIAAIEKHLGINKKINA
jgi:septal ring factor EnvC (AmiA/AmiB activator)